MDFVFFHDLIVKRNALVNSGGNKEHVKHKYHKMNIKYVMYIVSGENKSFPTPHNYQGAHFFFIVPQKKGPQLQQQKHGTGTRKEVPGKGDSFWKPSFSGSMLNFGGVCGMLGRIVVLAKF